MATVLTASSAMRQLLRRLRRLLPDQKGNIAVIVAAVFPLLIGCAGLAIDGVEWVLQKREVQAAADSAAMAGVYSLIQSQDLQNAVGHAVFQTGSIPNDASVQAVQGPPGHESDPFAVAVRLAVPAHMTFSSMFMKHAPVISAESTASVVKNGRYCAFALGDMDDQAGIVLRENTDAQVECGITTNATSPHALEADGSSTLQAYALRAYGSFSGARAAIQRSGVREHSLSQDDPLADTEPPLIPNTGCPNVTFNPGESEVSIDPGCYGNMFLNGNVRLQDGEYILNRGNFVVGPQAHVECDACTIYLTSEDAGTAPGTIGKVKISSEATVKMGATREGPDAGILFYQDRRGTNDLPGDENRIGGNSFSRLKGLLYFPSQTLYLDGNMNPDMQCTRFISRRLVFAGHVYIGKNCDGDRMIFAVTEVRLIG